MSDKIIGSRRWGPGDLRSLSYPIVCWFNSSPASSCLGRSNPLCSSKSFLACSPFNQMLSITVSSSPFAFAAATIAFSSSRIFASLNVQFRGYQYFLSRVGLYSGTAFRPSPRRMTCSKRFCERLNILHAWRTLGTRDLHNRCQSG